MSEYTVIGFVDESGDVHVAGVIEGRVEVWQGYYDRWWVVVEASSPASAGALAEIKIQKQLDEEQEEING